MNTPTLSEVNQVLWKADNGSLINVNKNINSRLQIREADRQLCDILGDLYSEMP